MKTGPWKFNEPWLRGVDGPYRSRDGDENLRISAARSAKARGVHPCQIEAVPDLDAKVLAYAIAHPMTMSRFFIDRIVVIVAGLRALGRRSTDNAIATMVYAKTYPDRQLPQFHTCDRDTLDDLHERVLKQVLAERAASQKAAVKLLGDLNSFRRTTERRAAKRAAKAAA